MPDSFEHEITYEVREDGVLYTLRQGVMVLIKPKGENSPQVAVEMWRGLEVPVAPEKGDLDSAPFREKLRKLAEASLASAEEREAKEPFFELLGAELGWIARNYIKHMNSQRRALMRDHQGSKPEEFVGTRYSIADGGFVHELKPSHVVQALLSGLDPFTRITNFVAEIVEEITIDDGAEAARHFKIRGVVEERVNLPEVDVPASQFAGMQWITHNWGVIANIAAGMGIKDQVREAIQIYSRGAPQRFIYQHTGFRKRGEKLIYLHADGAIGLEGVEVELQDKLDRYALPYHINENKLADAVRRSLTIMDVAPDRVTVPMLALTYLSVLSEITPPDFVLWLWAATGNLKSSLAAVVLSHFGDFSEDNLPVEFTATANYIERVLFLLKDTLIVVDDWRPAVSRGDAAEQDRKAQRLLRGVGNRAGRGRMRSDTSLRHTYIPRGGVMVTAESIPEGPAFESAVGRSLTVNVTRDEVDLAVLSELQENKAELGVAMYGFIARVAENYDEMKTSLPKRRRELRETFIPLLAESHSRTPTIAAALSMGFELFTGYAREVGAIDEEGHRALEDRGRRAILEACEQHTHATTGDDPASRFVDILRTLFSASRAYVKDVHDGTSPDDWRELGWELRETAASTEMEPARGATFVGWADKEYLYLDKEAAYAAVAGFAQRGDIPFGIKPRTLWRSLKRAGVTLCDPNRVDTTKRVAGKKSRVVQVLRDAVLGDGKDV